MQRRALMLAAIVGLVAGVFPSAPAAQASVAPWTWKRVTQSVSVAANSTYGVRALCPSGFTAVTGGLQLPATSQLIPTGEYRQDDGAGSGFTMLFHNGSTSTGTATVVAECVETADLPSISYNYGSFNRNSSGYASGEVGCLNAGEVPITGGVDWSNTSGYKDMTSSVPGWGETSWYGAGYSDVSGAQLTVEVYCVSDVYVPGFQKIEVSTPGSGWVTSTITCPAGKRILTGGNLDYVNSSYPNLTTWTASSLHYSDGQVTHLRMFCIDAGSPTVSLAYASPGSPGAVTGSAYANFQVTGSDPAGDPNGFKCSLDGGAAANCGSFPGYGPLSAGSHQLVAWNTTPDGRTSGAATYQWTIDTTAPTVTKPKLAKVTLTPSTTAKWKGSDVGSSIDHYAAAYRMFHADGTSTGWIAPPEWASLTSPKLNTPDLAQGESVCVIVRALDKAQNSSSFSKPSCTTRPFDDRGMTATAGWTRGTGSAYWQSTVTRTTASGETLKRNNVHLNRVGVVATVCPGCGSVVVKVGGTKIGKISLDAATRVDRRVKLLPAFGDQAGAVTLKSTTSGHEISIDGLVAIQGTSTGL
jgi:hypothetical protein